MLSKERGSNNTNKLSPQEPDMEILLVLMVQIIQINLVLKNSSNSFIRSETVQIIQINLVLKNGCFVNYSLNTFK